MTYGKLPVLETLRRIWMQNYYQEGETIHWREEKDCPPARLRIASPYDTETRKSTKNDLFWQGYKVHFTETCDADTPHLITHVETTPATEQDTTAMPRIHAALATKQLLPRQHFVDAGYPSAELLAASQSDFGIDLYGPVRPDITWQARDEQAFKLSEFHVDWEKRKVTCPMGKTSLNWISGRGVRGKPYLQARFRKQDCLACVSRRRCTRTKSAPRNITLQPTQEQQSALQAARERQKSKLFWETYSLRSGIEGTINQAVDKLGMRRSRYRGMAKTHFQHLVTAAVINIQRILSWLVEAPRSVTYQSHLTALAAV
jgi:DDE family transposase